MLAPLRGRYGYIIIYDALLNRMQEYLHILIVTKERMKRTKEYLLGN